MMKYLLPLSADTALCGNALRTSPRVADLLSKAMSHSVSLSKPHSMGDWLQERAWSEKRSSNALALLFRGAIYDVLEGEWGEFVSGSHIELVLELHPGEGAERDVSATWGGQDLHQGERPKTLHPWEKGGCESQWPPAWERSRLSEPAKRHGQPQRATCHPLAPTCSKSSWKCSSLKTGLPQSSDSLELNLG